MFPTFGGPGLMFSIIPVFIGICFIFVFGGIIIIVIKGILQWGKNNRSPVLTVDATVVAKREDVSHSYHNTGTNNMGFASSSTAYYVTFQVESGDRIELKMSGSDYGMLAENDSGKLTFQGTRYLSFSRNGER